MQTNSSGRPIKAGRAFPRETGTGLLVALNRARSVPDPPGLHLIRGNNGPALRELAKIVHCMCDGRPGETCFIGSLSFSKALGCSHVSVQRRLRQLEALGVVRRTWTGGLCRRAPDGHDHPNGALVKRASEYTYLGLPAASW